MTRLMTALLAATLLACGDHGHGHDHGHGSHDHHHDPKHGGHLTELGAHEGFLETKLDHAAGTLTIWIYLGEEMIDTQPAREPVLNLKTKDGPKSLTAKREGDHWVFRDDALKSDPEEARFRIVAGGKTYTPELVHHHE
ncbi:MAG: hypothetical protein AAGD14_09675 [Planctomycetota bacterium]